MELKNFFAWSSRRTLMGVLTFSLMGIATSCSSEDSPVEPGVDPSQPITFITNISDGNDGVSTRANNGTWEEDDRVGIFMLDATNDKLSKAHHKANKQYKIESYETTKWKLVSVDALYYPVDGSNVHFTAYYPYSASVGATGTAGDQTPGTYAVTLGTQSNTKTFDLLYHKGTTSYSKASSSSPTMAFTHQLSKVTVKIKLAAEMADSDVSNMAVTIKNIPTTADFNLATGELSNWGTTGNVTTNALSTPTKDLPEGEVVRIHQAIIVPHSAANKDTYSNRTIDVAFNDPDGVGATLTYEIPNADYKAFSSGKETVYVFTLKRNVITVENVTVVNWTQDGSDINEVLD